MDLCFPFSTSLRSHEWWKEFFLLWLVNVSIPAFLMPQNVQPRSSATHDDEESSSRYFPLESSINFRHAFLIFDLNEKKQRAESSTKKRIFNFFMGKSWGEFASLHVSMIFKFLFLSFLFLLCIFMWRSTGKTYGKKWAQERGTDTQSGRQPSERSRAWQGTSSGIWDFVVRSWKGFLLWRTLSFRLLLLLMHGKIFLLAHEENDSEINLITSRGRRVAAVGSDDEEKNMKKHRKAAADVGHHQTSEDST